MAGEEHRPPEAAFLSSSGMNWGATAPTTEEEPVEEVSEELKNLQLFSAQPAAGMLVPQDPLMTNDSRDGTADLFRRRMF